VAPGRTFKNSRRRTLPTITEETTQQVHYEKVANVSEVRIILPSCDHYSDSTGDVDVTVDMDVTLTTTTMTSTLTIMDHADECEDDMDWESTPHDDFVDFVAEAVAITSSTTTMTTTAIITTSATSTESVLMSGAGSATVEGCIGLKLLDDLSPTLSDEFVDFVADPIVIPSSTSTTTTTSPTSTELGLISGAGLDGCIGLKLLDDPSKALSSADFEPSTTILLHDDVPSPEQQLVLDIQTTSKDECRNEEMDQDHHHHQEPCFVAIAAPLSNVNGSALRRSKRLAEIRLRQEKMGLMVEPDSTAVTLSTSVQVVQVQVLQYQDQDQVPELLGSIVVNGRRRSSRHVKKTV
jgi:hypothetical protein